MAVQCKGGVRMLVVQWLGVMPRLVPKNLKPHNPL